MCFNKNQDIYGDSRLASIGILRKEREPGVGKLGWHGNFDTGFERNISFKIPSVAHSFL